MCLYGCMRAIVHACVRACVRVRAREGGGGVLWFRFKGFASRPLGLKCLGFWGLVAKGLDLGIGV